jgi:cysteine synthase A
MIDGLCRVPEKDTVAICRSVTHQYGILIGGSTGSVLAAIIQQQESIPKGSIIVAIAADLGERYLDSIYDDEWVRSHFPSLKV